MDSVRRKDRGHFGGCSVLLFFLLCFLRFHFIAQQREGRESFRLGSQFWTGILFFYLVVVFGIFPLAGAEGIEPPFSLLERDVLPLDYAPTIQYILPFSFLF